MDSLGVLFTQLPFLLCTKTSDRCAVFEIIHDFQDPEKVLFYSVTCIISYRSVIQRKACVAVWCAVSRLVIFEKIMGLRRWAKLCWCSPSECLQHSPEEARQEKKKVWEYVCVWWRLCLSIHLPWGRCIKGHTDFIVWCVSLCSKHHWRPSIRFLTLTLKTFYLMRLWAGHLSPSTIHIFLSLYFHHLCPSFIPCFLTFHCPVSHIISGFFSSTFTPLLILPFIHLFFF